MVLSGKIVSTSQIMSVGYLHVDVEGGKEAEGV